MPCASKRLACANTRVAVRLRLLFCDVLELRVRMPVHGRNTCLLSCANLEGDARTAPADTKALAHTNSHTHAHLCSHKLTRCTQAAKHATPRIADSRCSSRLTSSRLEPLARAISGTDLRTRGRGLCATPACSVRVGSLQQ